jgi:hypothetical protein
LTTLQLLKISERTGDLPIVFSCISEVAMFGFSADVHLGIFRDIIGKQLSPFLSERGFLKRGNGFYKNEGEVVKGITAERFRFNSFAKYSFFLNVLIFGGNYRTTTTYTDKSLFANGMLLFSRNMGFFRNNDMYMYDIDPNEDASIVAEKIKSDLAAHVFPLFDDIMLVDDIERRVSPDNFSFAIALSRLGRKDDSARFFRKSIDVDAPRIVEASDGSISMETYVDNVRNAASREGVFI